MKPSGQGMEADLKRLTTAMMETGAVDALVLPTRQADGRSVMPALITSPGEVEKAVFLSPSFFINTARMVSRLSFKSSGRKTAVWMRPCEIRAFSELVKLNQASRDELVILGMDCPMALDRNTCRDYMETHGKVPDHWAGLVYPDPADPADSSRHFSRACSVCTSPIAVNSDLNFLFYSRAPDQGGFIEAGTTRGREILDQLSLDRGEVPDARATIIRALVKSRQTAFDDMAGGVARATDNLGKLETFFGACINCYNCRNVCPVCYCRECVFNTDVFSHEPVQYHEWADKWGQIKLPSDTLFYHLTRLAHMSHACVGCGQCTLACPSQIPVASLFTTVARVTQAAFDYEPGSDDLPPFSEFNADEYQDVVGMD